MSPYSPLTINYSNHCYY